MTGFVSSSKTFAPEVGAAALRHLTSNDEAKVESSGKSFQIVYGPIKRSSGAGKVMVLSSGGQADLTGYVTVGSICKVVPPSVKFHALRKEWETRTMFLSSPNAIAADPSYLRIIGMGADAIPLILGQLEQEGDEPGHWFVALGAITGEDPVDPASRGDMREMARRWIDWGRHHAAW